ncbi:MAG: hypothetical protein JW908_13640 [Anaerolineales bacterium]|nr:hypothetical protein [Anaerolineales bacterium]
MSSVVKMASKMSFGGQYSPANKSTVIARRKSFQASFGNTVLGKFPRNDNFKKATGGIIIVAVEKNLQLIDFKFLR